MYVYHVPLKNFDATRLRSFLNPIKTRPLRIFSFVSLFVSFASDATAPFYSTDRSIVNSIEQLASFMYSISRCRRILVSTLISCRYRSEFTSSHDIFRVL